MLFDCCSSHGKFAKVICISKKGREGAVSKKRQGVEKCVRSIYQDISRVVLKMKRWLLQVKILTLMMFSLVAILS